MREPARLRRTYFDCRYGQLHVHQAIPPGGGFDEATPIVCIPGAAGDGRFYAALLGPLGADRSIYAPDLPGCGQSDATGAEGVGAAERGAHAIADLLDSLRQRKVDVIAHGEGVQVLRSLAAQRPTLLRRVLLSAPAAAPAAAGAGTLPPSRELQLADATAAAIAPAAVASHLGTVMSWFGSAGSG